MSFTITDEKSYVFPKDVVYKAAIGAIDGLEGKLVEENESDGVLAIKFHKTILGKVLGDRTHMDVKFEPRGEETAVSVSCYPLDAVGRKLNFGARKGVSKTVVTWFYAHLEHRLPKAE